MRSINVIEFYSRLGVNPNVYIAFLAAIVVVVFLILAVFQSLFLKNVYMRMGYFDKDASEIYSTLTELDMPKKKQAKAIFTDAGGQIYTFSLSKLDAAFLTMGDTGMLRFKGDKFIGFKPVDEEIISNE